MKCYECDLLNRLKHLRLDISRFPPFMLQGAKPQTLEECIDIWNAGFPNILFQRFENIPIQCTLDGAIILIQKVIDGECLECKQVQNITHAIDYNIELLSQYDQQYLYEYEVLERSKELINLVKLK